MSSDTIAETESSVSKSQETKETPSVVDNSNEASSFSTKDENVEESKEVVCNADASARDTASVAVSDSASETASSSTPVAKHNTTSNTTWCNTTNNDNDDDDNNLPMQLEQANAKAQKASKDFKRVQAELVVTQLQVEEMQETIDHQQEIIKRVEHLLSKNPSAQDVLLQLKRWQTLAVGAFESEDVTLGVLLESNNVMKEQQKRQNNTSNNVNKKNDNIIRSETNHKAHSSSPTQASATKTLPTLSPTSWSISSVFGVTNHHTTAPTSAASNTTTSPTLAPKQFGPLPNMERKELSQDLLLTQVLNKKKLGLGSGVSGGGLWRK